VLTVAALVLLRPLDGRAQSGGAYALTWSSLDCGSATTASSAAYSLQGTVGQADGGNLAGGAYALHGGYWNAGRVATDAPLPDLTEGTGPLVFRLHGNAPNPFAVNTTIAFSLAHEEQVDLEVFDLAGRLVRRVLERRLGRVAIRSSGTVATNAATDLRTASTCFGCVPEHSKHNANLRSCPEARR
jgi:hypothetical protein